MSHSENSSTDAVTSVASPERSRANSDTLKPRLELFLLLLISLCPIALTSFIWLELWHGLASRAIDGSGHYAIAQIYDRSTFPDTFGWTRAYFGGMSFPNFYPPLFFWLVSLLHYTKAVSFATAFKVVIAIPLLVIPAAIWAVTRFHSKKHVNAALGAAMASATLITMGEVFQPSSGLDISSTVLDGFYTQPLGFLALLLWILVYLIRSQTWWQFTLAAILLAATVLANFFNAITAVLFIVTVIISDLLAWKRERNQKERDMLRRSIFLHFSSPAVALGLTAFWLVPMISTYGYLVTRPIVEPISKLATIPILCWYALGVVGVMLWSRRPKGRLGPYLSTCIALFVALIASDMLAPRWFPLQSFRFFSTLNFMLSIPVGIVISHSINWYVAKKRQSRDDRYSEKNASVKPTISKQIIFGIVTMIVLALMAFTMSSKKLTEAFGFYTPENFGRISAVLEFAREHAYGRYLVEVLPSRTDHGLIRADSLALNSYLGAQGNETTSVVYREASPNSGFFNAQLNAFSAYKENFGISSVLMDDVDFIKQPLAQHFERLRFTGVRYLVIGSADMKERLSRETELVTRYDIGAWSVFELLHPPPDRIRALEYRPALVVSDFSVKLRRENELDFIRLAEEQYNDAWFDVLLAYSPGKKVDQVSNLDQFGALIVDKYESVDEAKAFVKLKEFAQTRPLILLGSDAPLLARVRESLADFPHAFVVERERESLGQWVEAMQPGGKYESSSIRQIWRTIRHILDTEKLPVEPARIEGEMGPLKVDIRLNGVSHGKNVPVLISTTFHPKWVRSDNEELYAVTPFFTLGFINESTSLTFERGSYDLLALWISLITLLSLFLLALICIGRRRRANRARRMEKNESLN